MINQNAFYKRRFWAAAAISVLMIAPANPPVAE
jgi:hypothetical protein